MEDNIGKRKDSGARRVDIPFGNAKLRQDFATFPENVEGTEVQKVHVQHLLNRVGPW